MSRITAAIRRSGTVGHHRPWAWLVVALVLLAGGFLEISHVAHQGKTTANRAEVIARTADAAANTANTALADFEAFSAIEAKRLADTTAARRAQNQHDKAQIRATALIARQRANDAARSAAQVAALSQQNRRAIAELSTTQAQLNKLESEQRQATARQIRAICVGVRSQLHLIIAGLAGPNPQPLAVAVLKRIDAQHCPS